MNFNSSYIFIEEVWNTTVQLSKFGFIYIAGVIPLYPDLLDLFDRSKLFYIHVIKNQSLAYLDTFRQVYVLMVSRVKLQIFRIYLIRIRMKHVNSLFLLNDHFLHQTNTISHSDTYFIQKKPLTSDESDLASCIKYINCPVMQEEKM